MCARICILLLCIQVVFSERCVSYTACECVTESNKVIDLTDAGNKEYPQFHDVLFDSDCNETKLYSYNPCFAFNSDKGTTVDSKNKPCSGAAACVKIPGGSDGRLPEEYMIGYQASAKFAFDGGNLYLNYSVPGSAKNLSVLLICEDSIEYVLSMVEPHCEDSDATILKLTSKYACRKDIPPPPQSTHGLSTGSKILIAFFTILLAYLLVGIVWNFCNGAQGIEVIPNIAFWNELPVLVMEGVSFTCSCFCRSSSYGEV